MDEDGDLAERGVLVEHARGAAVERVAEEEVARVRQPAHPRARQRRGAARGGECFLGRPTACLLPQRGTRGAGAGADLLFALAADLGEEVS
jgi:hypothetical protein